MALSTPFGGGKGGGGGGPFSNLAALNTGRGGGGGGRGGGSPHPFNSQEQRAMGMQAHQAGLRNLAAETRNTQAAATLTEGTAQSQQQQNFMAMRASAQADRDRKTREFTSQKMQDSAARIRQLNIRKRDAIRTRNDDNLAKVKVEEQAVRDRDHAVLLAELDYTAQNAKGIASLRPMRARLEKVKEGAQQSKNKGTAAAKMASERAFRLLAARKAEPDKRSGIKQFVSWVGAPALGLAGLGLIPGLGVPMGITATVGAGAGVDLLSDGISGSLAPDARGARGWLDSGPLPNNAEGHWTLGEGLKTPIARVSNSEGWGPGDNTYHAVDRGLMYDPAVDDITSLIMSSGVPMSTELKQILVDAAKVARLEDQMFSPGANSEETVSALAEARQVLEASVSQMSGLNAEGTGQKGNLTLLHAVVETLGTEFNAAANSGSVESNIDQVEDALNNGADRAFNVMASILDITREAIEPKAMTPEALERLMTAIDTTLLEGDPEMMGTLLSNVEAATGVDPFLREYVNRAGMFGEDSVFRELAATELTRPARQAAHLTASGESARRIKEWGQQSFRTPDDIFQEEQDLRMSILNELRHDPDTETRYPWDPDRSTSRLDPAEVEKYLALLDPPAPDEVVYREWLAQPKQ